MQAGKYTTTVWFGERSLTEQSIQVIFLPLSKMKNVISPERAFIQKMNMKKDFKTQVS